ncbi:MAG: archaellin/type IV pilin N-terminal domain-containing protein [Candidatus Saliniplasma sp.]
MRRRNVLKNEEAVSPVIATILMVAITVVLAATLYMMLPDAEETTNPVSGTISAEYEEDYEEGDPDVVIISFDVMGTPRQPELDDLEVNIVGDTEDQVEEDLSTDDLVDWSYLTEDDTVVRADSEIVLEWEYAGTEEPNRVVIFIDGYDGSLTADI